MKKLFVFLMLLALVSFSIFATCFDISLSLGQDNYKWWNNGISFSYGINFGLSQKVELGFWGISDVVPDPFKSNMFGSDISITLLGRRSSGTKVAGTGINTLLSIGCFYRTDNNGVGPIVSLVPLTVGNPITGRRERLLKTGIGWDFKNSQLVVLFSLLSLNFYVKGTYRDYSY